MIYRSAKFGWVFSALLLVSCNFSDPLGDTRPTATGEDMGVDVGQDVGEVDLCGDGTVDPGETCDGDCPASCDDGDMCTADALTGAAATCDAVCTNTAIEGCSPDLCGNGTVDPGETCDGDCPLCDDGDICTTDVTDGDASTCDVVCSTTTITDCVDPAKCGNGTLDFGETCDGDCPTCDDGDICTTDTSTGDAATCDVVCTNEPIPNCIDPADCGNGAIDPGETCDGNCPTCTDGLACTTDVTVGSAATCNTACTFLPITSCVNADGCCPTGCTSMNDDDCACIPKTCAGEGQTCGVLDDGCGQFVPCGTCGQFESCLGTQCMASQGVGDPCIDGTNCPRLPNPASSCLPQIATGFPGGYCSTTCAADVDCPAGTGCVLPPNATEGACFLSCTANNQCRAGYQCADRDRDGDTECVPVGTGSNGVGQACTVINNCSGGVDARCFPGQSDGRWQGGYCHLACLSDTNCPGGSHCSVALGSVCLDECATDAECRPGHRCVDADSDGRKECWGALSRPVGAACDANEQCAIWNPPAPTGCAAESSSEYPGGYCTANCSTDSECPGGTHCSQGLCKLTCVGSSQCRTPSYACYDRDGDSRLECDAVGSGTGALGSPCSLRSDCAGGQTASCIKGDAAGRWGSGYCSTMCSVDSQCPSGSHCWASQLCLEDCATGADCRTPGFICIDADGDTRRECFGGFNGSVGDPCQVGNDCGAATNTVPQCYGAPYPGGYCTGACTSDADCLAGSTCYANSQCELTCLTAADCRVGYNCVDADSDGDMECHP